MENIDLVLTDEELATMEEIDEEMTICPKPNVPVPTQPTKPHRRY